jgi:hypothetical protein
MAYTLAQQPPYTLSPQMVIRLSMVMGLLALVYALVTQNLLVALGIAALPAALLVILYCVRHPRMGILLYLFATYFLMAIWRIPKLTDGVLCSISCWFS